jgi:hypothetical protein
MKSQALISLSKYISSNSIFFNEKIPNNTY